MPVHFFKSLKSFRLFISLSILLQLILCAPAALADVSAPGGYGLKIFRVNSVLYPFVQVYVRTFDNNKRPLVNLNAMNIGLMVKGRSYDIMHFAIFTAWKLAMLFKKPF